MTLKEKIKYYWLQLIKRKKQLEEEKKKKEHLGLLFYFKKMTIVSGAFVIGTFLPSKTKKEEVLKINLEKNLKKIQKIRDSVNHEIPIDKVNDLKLELEIEEIEIQDQIKSLKQSLSPSILEIKENCEQEIHETKEIIQKKIEQFENRLEENLVKTKKEEKIVKKVNDEEKKDSLALENSQVNISDRKKTEKKYVTPPGILAAEVVAAAGGLVLDSILSKPEENPHQIEQNINNDGKIVDESSVLLNEEKGENEKISVMTDKDEQVEKIEVLTQMEEKKKISKEEVADLLMMSKIIDENIKKNKEKVEKLKKEMKEIHPVLRKQGFLGKMKTFMDGMFHSALSLIPMKLFKNKTIGILTSAVLINNSIRSMRNTMRKEEYYLDYLGYERINNKATSTISNMDKIYYICEDSLEHIQSLKQELLMKYEINEDLENIISEINALEENVASKMRQVEKTKSDLNNVQKEIKQKILKKDYI